MKLTPKQEAFCREYLIDLNATQAAIRAGYSEKTAANIGSENLIKPHIQQHIQASMDKRAEKVAVSAEWVLNQAVKSYEFNAKPAYDALGNEVMTNATAAAKFLEMCGKHVSVKAFDKEETTAVDTMAESIAKLVEKLPS